MSGEATETQTTWVPIIFDDSSSHTPNLPRNLYHDPNGRDSEIQPQTLQRKRKTKQEVPIEGINTKPGQTISRGGEEGKQVKSDGPRRAVARRDSFHDRITDYIIRARLKFLTVTSVVNHGNSEPGPDSSGSK